jgi:hypothetical protein
MRAFLVAGTATLAVVAVGVIVISHAGAEDRQPPLTEKVAAAVEPSEEPPATPQQRGAVEDAKKILSHQAMSKVALIRTLMRPNGEFGIQAYSYEDAAYGAEHVLR